MMENHIRTVDIDIVERDRRRDKDGGRLQTIEIYLSIRDIYR